MRGWRLFRTASTEYFLPVFGKNAPPLVTTISRSFQQWLPDCIAKDDFSLDPTIGTYIFDEVDAGVGGKAALEVGKRLRKLAMNSQVIVVTHLPQVALWADNHILVEKDSNGLLSSTSIKSLSDQEREIEIARMLSGIEESEHAQDHARELLNLRFSDVG